MRTVGETPAIVGAPGCRTTGTAPGLLVLAARAHEAHDVGVVREAALQVDLAAEALDRGRVHLRQGVGRWGRWVAEAWVWGRWGQMVAGEAVAGEDEDGSNG